MYMYMNILLCVYIIRMYVFRSIGKFMGPLQYTQPALNISLPAWNFCWPITLIWSWQWDMYNYMYIYMHVYIYIYMYIVYVYHTCNYTQYCMLLSFVLYVSHICVFNKHTCLWRLPYTSQLYSGNGLQAAKLMFNSNNIVAHYCI